MFEYKGNKFAKLCCDLVAENKAPFTTLLLYGPNGCGKSAFLDYIISKGYEFNPDRKFGKFSANVLLSDNYRDRWSFSSECKQYDVVLIDNLEVIANKPMLSCVMYDIIADLEQSKKKVVIAAEHSVVAHPKLYDQRFYKRMQWETEVKIEKPTSDEMVRALKEMACDAKIKASKDIDEVIDLIVKNNGDNLGMAMSSFRRVFVRSDYDHASITKNYAEDVLFAGCDIELIEG